MRHLNQTCKLNRNTSHRRCMFANMLKALITHESIQTTLPKAKALRRYADHMITLAKKNNLSARRKAIAELMIRFNTLTPKEQRAAREGNKSAYNDDRLVIEKLFDLLGKRFANRNGGYTRIVKQGYRVGDNASKCKIEYLAE
jgi:large subunit ribosomal protein L17